MKLNRGFSTTEVLLSLLLAMFVSAALSRLLWQHMKHFSQLQKTFQEDSRQMFSFVEDTLFSSCSEGKYSGLRLLHCIHEENKKILSLNFIIEWT